MLYFYFNCLIKDLMKTIYNFVFVMSLENPQNNTMFITDDSNLL
jgi:hypothetical protein